jgi:hypothetical protein
MKQGQASPQNTEFADHTTKSVDDLGFSQEGRVRGWKRLRDDLSSPSRTLS